MICLRPRSNPAGKAFPCGNCTNCRINLQKVWASRILLESYFHPQSTFITLTYNDEHVPTVDGVPQLWKPDVTRFIEKFRYLTREIKPPRYFFVGEYGAETWRPHYHAILFGHGLECETYVHQAWTDKDGEPIGFHQLGELTYDRAMYTAQYCMKKMTREGDPWLKGRLPEFSRPSKGIGLPAVGWLADTLGKSSLIQENEGFQLTGDELLIDNPRYGPALRLMGDVFNVVRIEGKMMPLGRYMRRKLRLALGLPECPRARAVALGRFDLTTGEILEENVPREWGPDQDISQINSPWRKHVEEEARKARSVEVEKRAEKAHRQQGLGLTTGGRI